METNCASADREDQAAEGVVKAGRREGLGHAEVLVPGLPRFRRHTGGGTRSRRLGSLPAELRGKAVIPPTEGSDIASGATSIRMQACTAGSRF